MTEQNAARTRQSNRSWLDWRGAWVALALTTYSQAAVGLISQSLGPLAPFWQAEFQVSRAEIGLAVAILYAGNMLTTIPGGRACDIWGERPLLIASCLITGLAAIVGSRSPTFGLLLLALAAVGFGNGLQGPAGSAAIIRWFPHRRRGLAFGVRQTGLPAAGAFASAVIPWLALTFDWRLAWAALAMVAILGSIIILLGYRERREIGPASDGATSMLPMRHVLADRRIQLVTLYSIMHLAVQFSATSFFVIFAHEALQYSIVAAGAVFAVTGILGAVSRILWGVASDAFLGGNRHRTLLIVSLLSIGACLLGAGLAAGLPSGLIWPFTLLLGGSTFAWTALQIALTSELFGRASAGTAVGLVLGVSSVGILAGPPLFGALVDATGSYVWAWLAGAVVLALGVLALRFVDVSGR